MIFSGILELFPVDTVRYWVVTPLLSAADCAFTQVKVPARRSHKERREVLCATNYVL